jgi:S1-C subfamily serine protease
MKKQFEAIKTARVVFISLIMLGSWGASALAQTPAELLRPTPEQRAASVKMVEQLRAAQSPLLQGSPGLLVGQIDLTAQAVRVGIAPGDVLLKYDGQVLTNPEQFVTAVAAKTAAGAGVPVQVVR